MFFTAVGRVVAFLLAFGAVFRITLAVLIASGVLPPEAQQRYLGSHSPGEVIDRATYVLAFSIILGVLTEISRTLRNRA
jgi:hypothetical protein